MKCSRSSLLIVALLLIGCQSTAGDSVGQLSETPEATIQSCDFSVFQKVDLGQIPTPDRALRIVGLGQIHDMSVSPDGNCAAISTSRALLIYDLTSYERVILSAHPAGLGQVDWSPDGKWIASEEYGKGLTIWDCATGEEVSVFQIWDAYLYHFDILEWSPDSSMLATTSYAYPLYVLDRISGEVMAKYELEYGGGPVSWFLDSKKLAVSSSDSTMLLVEIGSNQTRTISLDGEHVEKLAVSPDGSKLAIAYGHEATDVYSGSGVRVVNINTGRELYLVEHGYYGPYSVTWSADGSRLLTGWSDGTVLLSNGKTGRQGGVLTQHNDGFAFRQDGVINAEWAGNDRIVSIGYDSQLQIYDYESREQMASFFVSTHTSDIEALTWSSNDKWLATAGFDGQVLIWDTTTYKVIKRIRHPEMTLGDGVAFSPDNDLLAVLALADYHPAFEEFIFVLDTGKWQIVSEPVDQSEEWLAEKGGTYYGSDQPPGWLAPPDNVWAIHGLVSPDGALIAVLDEEEQVRVGDVDTETILYTVKGYPWPTPGILAFSPDSQILVTDLDTSLAIWDASTGERIGAVPVIATSVTFSPDGLLLGVGHGDGTITLWDVETLLSGSKE